MPRCKSKRTFFRKVKNNTDTCYKLMNEHVNLDVDANVNSNNMYRINSSSERNSSSEIDEIDDSDSSIANDEFSNLLTEDCSNTLNNLDSQLLTISNINFDVNLEDNSLENNFLHGLRQWAITCNVPHGTLRQLLNLLKTIPIHSNLPSDPRTLLSTPRKTFSKIVEPGMYVHFGLKCAVEKLTSTVDICTISSIDLLVNIDGLPLSKSSSSQIYPILCSLYKYPSNISVIGIYHGYEKPTNANEFLSEFVKEAIELVNDGFVLQGQVLPFTIKGFICDAPAKSYITFCKGHSGFYSCTKCIQKGKYIKGRVCFIKNNAKKRTNESFRRKLQPEYHNGVSILENIPSLGMVTNFPLEYMHLICLGVVKKLLCNIWLHGKPSHKLSKECVRKISDLLLSLKSYVPMEFVRKTRSLDEVKRWKATEFRFFLLYTGPLVLLNLIPSNKYLHFLTLHIAIRILMSTDLKKTYIEFANSLLLYFIDQIAVIYGYEYISHNVHGLAHIVEDTKIYGTLDFYSAFPFENCLQILKKLVRKPNQPLPQIVRRLHEKDYVLSTCDTTQNDIVLSIEHNEGPLPSNDFEKEYKKCTFKYFTLSTSSGNNCCLLKDMSVVLIENFAIRNNNYYIIGKKFQNVSNFFNEPCQSSRLNIYSVDNLGSTSLWLVNDVSNKFVIFPNNKCFVVFPLLHV